MVANIILVIISPPNRDDFQLTMYRDMVNKIITEIINVVALAATRLKATFVD